MEDLILRECSIKDIDAICELQRMWNEEDITYGFRPANKEYLIKKLGKYFLAAEYKDKIIGFIYATVYEAKDMSIFNDGEQYMEVDDIYVVYKYRNSGAGSLLIEKLLDTAQKNGIERSLIYSATKNLEDVVGFYKKHGFKTWFVQMYK